jgi:hypothetical protein
MDAEKDLYVAVTLSWLLVGGLARGTNSVIGTKSMKKQVSLILVTVLLASISQASVSFKWANATAGSATYWNGSSYVNAPGGAASGYLLLTYISGDSTINFDAGVPLSTSYGAGGLAGGADTLVGATNITFSGMCSAAVLALGAAGTGHSPETYVGYYAYAVLVAIPRSTFATTYSSDVSQIPVGTLYGLTSISPQLTQYDVDPPGTPTTQLFSTTTVQAGVALVPEPSTFALLGIGLGLVGLRRFRRK